MNEKKTKEKQAKEFFYSQLSQSEIEIVSQLKEILNSFTSLEERISYSVLYYFQNSRVCFIWPSSIKQGPKSGVQLGFCNGYLLSDPNQILERENRKQVYCFTFHTPKEIDKKTIIPFLQNAIEVDATLYATKKKLGRSKSH